MCRAGIISMDGGVQSPVKALLSMSTTPSFLLLLLWCNKWVLALLPRHRLTRHRGFLLVSCEYMYEHIHYYILQVIKSNKSSGTERNIVGWVQVDDKRTLLFIFVWLHHPKRTRRGTELQRVSCNDPVRSISLKETQLFTAAALKTVLPWHRYM